MQLPSVQSSQAVDATVTVTMTPGQAQAVFDRLYAYDTADGFLDRYIVARRLLESGAVRDRR